MRPQLHALIQDVFGVINVWEEFVDRIRELVDSLRQRLHEAIVEEHQVKNAIVSNHRLFKLGDQVDYSGQTKRVFRCRVLLRFYDFRC